MNLTQTASNRASRTSDGRRILEEQKHGTESKGTTRSEVGRGPRDEFTSAGGGSAADPLKFRASRTSDGRRILEEQKHGTESKGTTRSEVGRGPRDEFTSAGGGSAADPLKFKFQASQALCLNFSLFLVAYLSMLASCSVRGQHLRSSNSLEIQQEVVSLGVAAGREAEVAKQKATARAKKNLVRMLKPQSVTFEFRSFSNHSDLLLTQQSDEVEDLSADFDKHKGWWVSKVFGLRSEESLAQMRRMAKKSIRASSKVNHPDPSLALMHAERRAFRQAIEKTLGAKQKPRYRSGKLTLLALSERLTDSGAQVDLLLHVQTIQDRNLTKMEQQELLDDVVREYRSLMEWPKAIDAIRKLMALSKPTVEHFQLLGRLYLYAQQPKQAADAFSSAAKLSPRDPDLIQQEIDAANRIPDKGRVNRLNHRLKQLRQKEKRGKKGKS